VFFAVAEDSMVLLHGFIKKSRKTPQNEIETALNRMRGLRR
jgi:phage-related protein